uniref:Uncharacterized protein n=1 Tax=Lygus hesperus TaxID=30085 RepID=A0A146L6N6_LYGHE
MCTGSTLSTCFRSSMQCVSLRPVPSSSAVLLLNRSPPPANPHPLLWHCNTWIPPPTVTSTLPTDYTASGPLAVSCCSTATTLAHTRLTRPSFTDPTYLRGRFYIYTISRPPTVYVSRFPVSVSLLAPPLLSHLPPTLAFTIQSSCSNYCNHTVSTATHTPLTLHSVLLSIVESGVRVSTLTTSTPCHSITAFPPPTIPTHDPTPSLLRFIPLPSWHCSTTSFASTSHPGAIRRATLPTSTSTSHRESHHSPLTICALVSIPHYSYS